MNGAVIVETRALPNLVDLINNHMKHLQGWGLTIYCSNENYLVLNKYFKDAKIVNIKNQINELTYNYMLCSKEFWESIEYDNILIFQHDSMLLRGGVEEFIGIDYIGAPIKHIAYPAMNGGLSLRTKKAMLDTLNTVSYNPFLHGNEDMFYSNYLVGKKATKEQAEIFSCETMFKLGTLGIHAIEKYLTESEVNKIKNQYV